jgi:hypothetical protein
MARKKPFSARPSDGLDRGTPEAQAKVKLEKVETDQKSFAYRIKDQRPIDKYHRWYCEDEARGVRALDKWCTCCVILFHHPELRLPAGVVLCSAPILHALGQIFSKKRVLPVRWRMRVG